MAQIKTKPLSEFRNREGVSLRELKQGPCQAVKERDKNFSPH
jgi:hypothetical protein